MSRVRFAMICDKCQRRSDEYSRWQTCVDCGDDVCKTCAAEYDDDPPGHAICKTCKPPTDRGPLDHVHSVNGCYDHDGTLVCIFGPQP